MDSLWQTKLVTDVEEESERFFPDYRNRIKVIETFIHVR